MDKPLGHKCYGHIPHLRGSRMTPTDKKCQEGQQLIATKKARDWRDLVIVQEKVDGSNVGIAKINNEIIPITRAGYVAITSKYKQHIKFYNWVLNCNYKRFHDLLKEGERLVGEWMIQAHGTRYDLPHEPFIAFDIMIGHERKTYMELLTRTAKYDIITPRLIHIGQPISIERVLKVLEPSGHGAIDPVEGAVWRVERNGKVDFLLKYVRPEKEDGIYLPEKNNEKAVFNKYQF